MARGGRIAEWRPVDQGRGRTGEFGGRRAWREDRSIELEGLRGGRNEIDSL